MYKFGFLSYTILKAKHRGSFVLSNCSVVMNNGKLDYDYDIFVSHSEATRTYNVTITKPEDLIGLYNYTPKQKVENELECHNDTVNANGNRVIVYFSEVVDPSTSPYFSNDKECLVAREKLIVDIFVKINSVNARKEKYQNRIRNIFERLFTLIYRGKRISNSKRTKDLYTRLYTNMKVSTFSFTTIIDYLISVSMVLSLNNPTPTTIPTTGIHFNERLLNSLEEVLLKILQVNDKQQVA